MVYSFWSDFVVNLVSAYAYKEAVSRTESFVNKLRDKVLGLEDPLIDKRIPGADVFGPEMNGVGNEQGQMSGENMDLNGIPNGDCWIEAATTEVVARLRDQLDKLTERHISLSAARALNRRIAACETGLADEFSLLSIRNARLIKWSKDREKTWEDLLLAKENEEAAKYNKLLRLINDVKTKSEDDVYTLKTALDTMESTILSMQRTNHTICTTIENVQAQVNEMMRYQVVSRRK